MKSKFIKEPLHIHFVETFTREEFFEYLMNSMPELDSEFIHNVKNTFDL